MTSRIQSFTHDGQTFTLAQTVHVPKFDYTGKITSIWRRPNSRELRLFVQRDGDKWPRCVAPDEVRAA